MFTPKKILIAVLAVITALLTCKSANYELLKKIEGRWTQFRNCPTVMFTFYDDLKVKIFICDESGNPLKTEFGSYIIDKNDTIKASFKDKEYIFKYSPEEITNNKKEQLVLIENNILTRFKRPY